MTPTDHTVAPTPLSGITGAISALLPTGMAVHGPYEDLGLAALKTLDLVIADAPTDVKQALWKDFLVWHTGLQTLASKLDFFHLFTPKS